LGCDTGWNNPFLWVKIIFEGLALILLANHYPKWLVLEVGTDRPGDIQSISKWLSPDIVVVTALPDVPVHVENFANPEAVIHEKKALVKALQSGGTLVISGDDKLTLALKKEFPKTHTLLFGMEAHNDVSASHSSFLYDTQGALVGMSLHIEEKGSHIPVQILGRVGKHQVYPVLSAFAVAQVLGMKPLSVAKALEKERGPKGRMKILEGFNDSIIIDDSYNSSPVALRAAITTLRKVEVTGKKIAVLGDMLELGRFSADAHKKVGVQITGVADSLITVGVRAKQIAAAAREAGFSAECIQEFDTGDAKEAGLTVRAMLEEGDVVLVKGSQSGIRLEKAIKEILAEPQRARELLVRQETEWLES